MSAYAAIRRDGGLSVIVTNLNDEPRSVAFSTNDKGPLQTVLLLDERSLAAEVPDPRSADGTSIDLAARSAMLLYFSAPEGQ